METLRNRKGAPEGTPNVSPPKLNVSDSFSSRYSVCHRLAEGGTSHLYVATDSLAPAVPVVIKSIKTSLLKAQKTKSIGVSEMNVSRQLSHPNLVSIYDLKHTRQSEYLVMEYLKGRSLKQLLAIKTFTYKQSIALLTPVVEVLDYLHGQGVIHSDVKPSNIMVGDDYGIKLIDLANCRQNSLLKNATAIVNDSHFYGYSLDYSSPQVINDQPATPSDDVFSLACILYELLEGKSPIIADKTKTDLSLSTIKKPKNINHAQWRSLQKAMSIDFTERYQSVTEFYEEFVKARKKIRRFFSIGLTGLVLLLTVMGGYKLWYNNQLNNARFQAAFESSDLANQVVHSILQEDDLKRYLAMPKVNQLDEYHRGAAVARLYPDVAKPLVSNALASLQAGNDSEQHRSLYAALASLQAYYPDSHEIISTQIKLLNEQKMLLEGFQVSINQLFDAGDYSSQAANKLIDLLDQYHLQWGKEEHKLKFDAYFYDVKEAFEAKQWLDFIELYQFGLSINNSSFQSAIMDVWSEIPVESQFAAAYSKFLAGEQEFPTSAADYFLKDDLVAIGKGLDDIWLNRVFAEYVSHLVNLRKDFKLPQNYQRLIDIEKKLIDKINNKIRFHQRSGQMNSVQFLTEQKKQLN